MVCSPETATRGTGVIRLWGTATGRRVYFSDTKWISNRESAVSETERKGPSPRRVAAGKLNRAKRAGLTPEGRRRLREAALRNQPWKHSTGPRTQAGKAQAVKNGKKRQLGPLSVREIRADLANVAQLLQEMGQARVLAKQATVVA